MWDERREEVEDLEDVRSDSGVRGGNGQEIGIGDMEEIGKTVCKSTSLHRQLQMLF